MGNRTIPILISTMILALLGIIFIQYKWIEESLAEKKRLVDHKVHQLAANVDRSMSDFESLAIMAGVPGLNNVFQEHMIITEDNYCSDPLSEDSMFLSHFYEFHSEDSLNQHAELQVRIIASDSLNHPLQGAFFCYDDSLSVEEEINDNKTRSLQFKIDEVNAVFERIQLEIGTDPRGARLDSITFAKELADESDRMGLIRPTDWAVFDNVSNEFAISPKENSTWDFELPIFKNDIVYPDRYTLYLSMTESNDAIWKQIIVMILLSLVFIAIIIFVFIYSIRLIIKHKKISAIKSDFINNMTHEFKTPLASISLAADSILHPKIVLNPEKVKDYVEIIKAEKTKLNKHIETILEVASLKENDVDIELTKIDLNHCINGAIDKLGLLIENRDCSIKLNLSEEVHISANSYHLENVFSNVIENSIKYSEEPPIINISSHRKKEWVEIQISDQGIGMTKEQIQKAFDNFYRAQKGNIHNTKGFGLGLSLVKYLVHKMNGTILIESEEKKGTTVIMQFQIRD